MPKVKAGSVGKGDYIRHKNQLYQITSASFINPGRGPAFMRLKIKNVVSGSSEEVTFRTGESVEELEVESLKLGYLYHDSQEVVFINTQTYEQVSVPSSLIADKLDILVPEMVVYVLFFEEKAIGVTFPPKVKIKVKSAPEAVAGDTVNAAKKEVEMETGLRLLTPLFIKTGEELVIDTATKQYLSRA